MEPSRQLGLLLTMLHPPNDTSLPSISGGVTVSSGLVVPAAALPVAHASDPFVERMSEIDKNIHNIIIPLVLKFNCLLDAQVLQHSLAITLALFPSISSRLQDRHWFINRDAGVHFETVRRDEVVAHFESAKQWASVDVFPKRVFLVLADSPLLEARLSLFEGEGNLDGISVLSVAMNHAVGDMASLVTFMTTWSLLCDTSGNVESLPADLVPHQAMNHRFTQLSKFGLMNPSQPLTLEMLLAMAPEPEKRRPAAKRTDGEVEAVTEQTALNTDASEETVAAAPSASYKNMDHECASAPVADSLKKEKQEPGMPQVVHDLSQSGTVNKVLEMRVDMLSLRAQKAELICELGADNEWFSTFELLASMLIIAHAGIADIASDDKSGGILGASANGFESEKDAAVAPPSILRVVPVISVRGRVSNDISKGGLAKNAFGNWAVYASGVDMLTPAEEKTRIAAGHLKPELPPLSSEAQRAVLLSIVCEFHAKLRQSIASLPDAVAAKEWVQLVADAGHAAELWTQPSLQAEELAYLGKINSAIVLNKYPTDPLIKLRFGSGEAVSRLLYSEDILFRSENYWLIGHRGGEQGDLTVILALSPGRADAFLKVINAWSFPFQVMTGHAA